MEQDIYTPRGEFGAFLRSVRRRRGLSQERLAERLCCTRIYIWKLETGRGYPSRTWLQLFGISCDLDAQEMALLESFKRVR